MSFVIKTTAECEFSKKDYYLVDGRHGLCAYVLTLEKGLTLRWYSYTTM